MCSSVFFATINCEFWTPIGKCSFNSIDILKKLLSGSYYEENGQNRPPGTRELLKLFKAYVGRKRTNFVLEDWAKMDQVAQIGFIITLHVLIELKSTESSS